jgi:hypothetical protein
MDCDQAAMGLPPVTSAVFVLSYHFGKMIAWASWRNIRDVSATSSGIKREWYVCMFFVFSFSQ